MDCTIRRNRSREGPALFTLWRDAVLATHRFLNPEHFARIERLVRNWIGDAELWVAADAQGAPVAFMALDGAHIDALFVSHAAHGRGIGRRMVAHARNLHPVLTVEVNEQNEGAVAFYERLGFRRTGRSETDHSGLPYPLLQLRLDEGAWRRP